MSTAGQKSSVERHSPRVAALVLGIDSSLRKGILTAFSQSHALLYARDRQAFVASSLQNESSSDVELAARLGVTKSAISNWRKNSNIRADKLDLLIALTEHHTRWPTSRERYDHAIIAACEYCRHQDSQDSQNPRKMTAEQLECVRLVLSSRVWSDSVIRRSRDETLFRDEADRICMELREKGVQREVDSLERIDAIVYDWLVPYLRCICVIRGESAIQDQCQIREVL